MPKSENLKVGDAAGSDVYLKMEGGYGEEFLVPGKPDDGAPGRLLIQKGDTITAGMKRRLALAEENAERIKGGSSGSGRRSRSSAAGDGGAARNPASGVGVPTATS